MTLSLSVINQGGIVLASDSRQTYQNAKGLLRVGSESAMKLFQLSPACGAVVAGRAFIPDANGVALEIGQHVRNFQSATDLSRSSVKEIAEQLNAYLANLFAVQALHDLRLQIASEMAKRGGHSVAFAPADGNLQPYSYVDVSGKQCGDVGSFETVEFIVAGYDPDGTGHAYHLAIPKGIVIEKDTVTAGAVWIGQVDVLSRVVKGVDPSIYGLPFVQNALNLGVTALDQLGSLEYIVNWSTITLQDAVDFCVLMIRTTESLQRFSDGTILSPGGWTGVGGPVDVAIISPKEGFNWLQQKKICVRDEM